MKAYRYITPEASFEIYPDNGWWRLMVNGSNTNQYATPEEAAEDVAAQNTGNTSWDSLEDVDAPPTLHDWDLFDFDPAMWIG